MRVIATDYVLKLSEAQIQELQVEQRRKCPDLDLLYANQMSSSISQQERI